MYEMHTPSKNPVVVIGTGLAGLSAANTLLQARVPVIVLEKAANFGGNSIKASSGINGASTSTQKALKIDDTPELFYQDTVKSSKGLGLPHLMSVMSKKSAGAIDWLQSFGLKLDQLAQLGGHSIQRTHRSSTNIPPGFEIVSTLSKPVKEHIRFNTKVTDLVFKEGKLIGVQCGEEVINTNHVVFATGGFGASKELLAKYRPDLVDLPTTNSELTTGDGSGILAKYGAQLIDMDQIQVHPTGFVDPADPTRQWKFLAAEALRGLGGILVDKNGKRFVNELRTRDEVTAAIEKAEAPIRLVLSEAAFQAYNANVKFYMSKGLMKQVPFAEFADAATAYSAEGDAFGRTHKINTFNSADEFVYVGEITPVVHFTMGGVAINEHGQVVTQHGDLDGVYAAGEVSGGVHGANRLGGSSLLECVVFGREVGNFIAKKY